MRRAQQPTVKQINSHVFAGTGYCMVYAAGWQARISWARTQKGVKQGRVINLSIDDQQSRPVLKEDRMGLSWVAIPADATVELT